MRHDQGRDEHGQFGTVDTNSRYHEEERLENVISCKITSRELRQVNVLFDQHRKIWGWQTQSDMLRDLFRDGVRDRVKMIAKPDPELVQMASETEQMERAKKASLKHLHHERSVEYTADQIDVLKRNNDFGEIRKLLTDFMERTKATPDPVIRQRRRDEFERRGWDDILKELSKGARLPIDD